MDSWTESSRFMDEEKWIHGLGEILIWIHG